jgi:hypothetical protein
MSKKMNMPTIDFKADGKTYKLQLSANAMVDVEEVIGDGFPKILSDLADQNKLSIRKVRALFWGCFRDFHQDVTIEQAGEMMMANGGLVRAIDLIVNLLGVEAKASAA